MSIAVRTVKGRYNYTGHDAALVDGEESKVSDSLEKGPQVPCLPFTDLEMEPVPEKRRNEPT